MKKNLNLNIMQFVLLSSAFGLRMASSGTVPYGYLALGIYALIGPTQSIQALAISWVFTMLSEGISPLASGASIGRYLVIACAALCMLLRSGLHNKKIYNNHLIPVTLGFGAFLVFHSMLFSRIVDVSILKAILWTVLMVTLFAAWGNLSVIQRVQLERQLFVGLIIIALISIPIAFTNTGYLLNGNGFQGVFNHPQAFGPTMAFLTSWLAGHMLKEARPSWGSITLIGLCFTFVVMSEARTAGLALVLGLLIPILSLPFIARIPALRLMPGLGSRRLHLVGFLGIIFLSFFGPVIVDRLTNYVNKRGDAVSPLEKLEESRGVLIQQMIANIKNSPLTGIGFGIASNPASIEVVRDPILGLPTGSPIEKGVLPLALVEELGIFGFTFSLVWLWVMLRRGKILGIIPSIVLATLLFTNLGESTFFSPGGFGLLPLILFAWAVSCGNAPMKDHNRPGGFTIAENGNNILAGEIKRNNGT